MSLVIRHDQDSGATIGSWRRPHPCEIRVIPVCFHVLSRANPELQRPTAQG